MEHDKNYLGDFSLMRMDRKFRIFFGGVATGGLLGEVFFLYLDAKVRENWPLLVFLAVWLLACGLLPHFLFRCPNCGEYALCSPGLMALHFPGARCKYCGLDY